MKVFLSWSGEKSKALAEAFGDWIVQVIQAVDPWISSGITKGTRWTSEIADHLEYAKVGIICLTPENLKEPWILFEAGALSKIKGSHVCTLLMGLQPTDVEQPLAQFNHTVAEKDDIRKLIKTINTALGQHGENQLPENVVNKAFDTYWGELEGKLKLISSQGESKHPNRTDREILEEMLTIIRNLEQRETPWQLARESMAEKGWTLGIPLSNLTSGFLGPGMVTGPTGSGYSGFLSGAKVCSRCGKSYWPTDADNKGFCPDCFR